jgi:hypothetical protein
MERLTPNELLHRRRLAEYRESGRYWIDPDPAEVERDERDRVELREPDEREPGLTRPR